MEEMRKAYPMGDMVMYERKPSPLAGKTVVITGKLWRFTRKEAHQQLLSRGAKQGDVLPESERKAPLRNHWKPGCHGIKLYPSALAGKKKEDDAGCPLFLQGIQTKENTRPEGRCPVPL